MVSKYTDYLQTERLLVAVNSTGPSGLDKYKRIAFVIRTEAVPEYDLRPYKDEIICAIEECDFFDSWFGERGTLWTRETLGTDVSTFLYNVHYAEFWGRVNLDPVWLLRLSTEQLCSYVKYCYEGHIRDRIKKELFRRQVEGEYDVSSL